MILDPSLRSAMILSTVAHLSLLVGGSRFDRYFRIQELRHAVEDLEISYPHEMMEVQASAMTASSTVQELTPQEDVLPPLPSKVSLEKESTFSEQELIQSLHLSHEEKPLYLTYYQNIREKIRKSAHAHYPQGTQKGEIRMSFVLFSSGRLKEITAKEADPLQGRRLKELAMRSVIEASPFPPFPEGLKRPFVPFRVVITFAGEKTYPGGE